MAPVADAAQHPVDGPKEVVGGGSGGAENMGRLAETDTHACGLPLGGEGDPVGGGDADEGRATDAEAADRLRHLGHALASQIDLLLRQARLVEDHHRAIVPTNRLNATVNHR